MLKAGTDRCTVHGTIVGEKEEKINHTSNPLMNFKLLLDPVIIPYKYKSVGCSQNWLLHFRRVYDAPASLLLGSDFFL